jgi:hypothetical protein
VRVQLNQNIHAHKVGVNPNVMSHDVPSRSLVHVQLQDDTKWIHVPESQLDSQIQAVHLADPPALHVLVVPSAHLRSHSNSNPVSGPSLPSTSAGSLSTVLIGALWFSVRSHQKSGAVVCCKYVQVPLLWYRMFPLHSSSRSGSSLPYTTRNFSQ